MRLRRRKRADPLRVHQLEYDLGLRDDAPPTVYTDAPGAVYYYDPKTQPRPATLSTVDTLLKQLYTS